jgi:hypothetical protein
MANQQRAEAEIARFKAIKQEAKEDQTLAGRQNALAALQHIAPPSSNHRLYGLYGDHAWRVRHEYRECAQAILFAIGTLQDKPA